MLIPMQQATQQAALIEAVRIDAKEAPNFALTIGEAINKPNVPAVPVIFPLAQSYFCMATPQTLDDRYGKQPCYVHESDQSDSWFGHQVD